MYFKMQFGIWWCEICLRLKWHPMPHGIPLGIMCTDEVIAWQNNYHCQVKNTRLRVEKDWLPGQFHIVNCGHVIWTYRTCWGCVKLNMLLLAEVHTFGICYIAKTRCLCNCKLEKSYHYQVKMTVAIRIPKLSSKRLSSCKFFWLNTFIFGLKAFFKICSY